MFVSPPPATSSSRLFSSSEGLIAKKKSNNNNNIVNNIGQQRQQRLDSISENSVLDKWDQNSGCASSINGSIGSTNSNGSAKEKGFINAPPEYASRARDEIRKRLSSSNLSNNGGTDNNSNLRRMNSHRSSRSTNSSNHSMLSDQSSIVAPSIKSNASSSLFSVAQSSILSSVDSSSSIIGYNKPPLLISLQEALPQSFVDMYFPEVLMDPSNLLSNGRPKFTKRELLDWDLNDIRSLLIVDKLRPEWGNQKPIIDFPVGSNGVAANKQFPNFSITVLPLDSPDEVIISTLVQSDLYIEHNLDIEFKLMSAKYTVQAARKRHESLRNGVKEPIMYLSKPEWRNIIENYLLNIAVEAQCRFDFKKTCNEYKKWKIERNNSVLHRPDMPPPSFIPQAGNKKSAGSNNGTCSLLKRALLKNSLKRGSMDLPQTNTNNNMNMNVNKVSLTKEEKGMIWHQVQTDVYQRLGLDWKPDNMI
ncbi:related to Protein STD1 [Saccharomycodes ludwigii]|uniref:Related to Protein STD1 n=1 Tax=Saccharomycodes ludwigii TaxID=36035 RepID=A0A376B8Q7_9ASCO|nr:related to Protein STD1 [Saccharomycodes ludwigii]